MLHVLPVNDPIAPPPTKTSTDVEEQKTESFMSNRISGPTADNPVPSPFETWPIMLAMIVPLLIVLRNVPKFKFEDVLTSINSRKKSDEEDKTSIPNAKPSKTELFMVVQTGESLSEEKKAPDRTLRFD
jgi:hypothetical protein